jgi:hypothetical protein
MALTFLGFSHLRQWCDDDYDYDVLEDGVVLGHIFFLDAVGQQGRPWMWASGHNGEIRRAAHGYEPTCEDAMAAFARSLRRQWARHANRTQPLNRESCDCDYKTRKESAEAAENQNVVDFGHRCVEEFGFVRLPNSAATEG